MVNLNNENENEVKVTDFYNWAKREIDIALRSKYDSRVDDIMFDTVKKNYYGALKAVKSILEDVQNGAESSIIVSILSTLLNAKPLSPIPDIDENWDRIGRMSDGSTEYQCNRKSTLFKRVNGDTVTYSELYRFKCKNYDSSITYTNGFISNLLNELYPITMPYCDEYFDVTIYECLTDKKNGDFDTIAILTVKKPNGEIDKINRYFKESGDTFVEIDESEYLDRASADLKIIYNESLEKIE